MHALCRTTVPFGRAFASVLVLALAGCGGGGGGRVGSTPPPILTPSPAPSPTPSPSPPATNFDTPEYRRSDGPAFHNALTAWQRGITGAGSRIAIIDTGIDTDSPEFAGRISSASRDVAGNGTIEAEDDHGTNIALVAAAARDNTGVVGIAFDSTIVALRADRPGTCARETDALLDGCEFFDVDLARGVDAAIAAGADVINLSLGGSPPDPGLRDAVRRAAQAGIVIVVSAGNDGDTIDGSADPNNPDPLATGLLATAPGNVIIVGSVGESGSFSAFSNRAGTSAASFLSARGERVCCVYDDGRLRVTTEADGRQFVTLFSGTSFAAPQVAGAVALLAQAFPNLSGAEIVQILLRSARDAGDAGTDSTYGRGILDIARAFQPIGTTSLGGTGLSLAVNEDVAIASPAMGDALANATLSTFVTDSFDRPFAIDLASRMREARPAERLRGALAQRGQAVTGGAGGTSLAFVVGPRGADDVDADPLRLSPEDAAGARVLAATAIQRLSPNARLALGFGQGGASLGAQMRMDERPAFLLAREAGGDAGFAYAAKAAAALRRQVGGWGITVAADSGDAVLGDIRRTAGAFGEQRERHRASSASLTFDRRLGAVDMTAGATWLQERATVLGAFLHPSLGASGSGSWFADVTAGWEAAPGWRFGAGWREGRTYAQAGGLLSSGSTLRSRAWSLDLERRGVFGSDDALALRIAQPLRVEGGALMLDLPSSFDWTSETVAFAPQRLSLSPSGREHIGELAWTGRMWGGTAAASLFWRTEPGHIASAPDDRGVALRWERRF